MIVWVDHGIDGARLRGWDHHGFEIITMTEDVLSGVWALKASGVQKDVPASACADPVEFAMRLASPRNESEIAEPPFLTFVKDSTGERWEVHGVID